MKKIFLVGCIVFGFYSYSQYPLLTDTSIFGAYSPNGLKNPKVYFKNFNAYSLTGENYSRESLNNKITLINFWFEACEPCLAEFEALNNLYSKFKKDKNFQLLSFTFENHEDALKIAEKYNMRYPIFSLKRDSLYELNFNLGFPSTIITDKQGKIRFIKCGGPREQEQANKVVDSIYSKEIEQLLFDRLNNL